MTEVKFCEKCLSKYTVDKTGICPNCRDKELPRVVKVKKVGKSK